MKILLWIAQRGDNIEESFSEGNKKIDLSCTPLKSLDITFSDAVTSTPQKTCIMYRDDISRTEDMPKKKFVFSRC